MNFKDWLTEYSSGFNWDMERDAERDPLGIRHNYEPMHFRGAEAMASGIGKAISKEAERTGAKAGSLGQAGSLDRYDPFGKMKKYGNTVQQLVSVPKNTPNLTKDDGQINYTIFKEEAIKLARVLIAAQELKKRPETVSQKDTIEIANKYVAPNFSPRSESQDGLYLMAMVQFRIAPSYAAQSLNPDNIKDKPDTTGHLGSHTWHSFMDN